MLVTYLYSQNTLNSWTVGKKDIVDPKKIAWKKQTLGAIPDFYADLLSNYQQVTYLPQFS